MKKIFIVALMALVSVAASAQVYVGGGLGFQYVSSSPKNGDSSSATVFSVNPEVGYYFNDKFAIGADFSLGMQKVKDCDAVFTTTEHLYARYDFVETGSFKFGAELAAGYKTFGKDSGGAFDVALRPVAQFAVSDKLSVVGRFNLLEYTKYNEKAGDGSNFSLGILNGYSTASIGVAYKF